MTIRKTKQESTDITLNNLNTHIIPTKKFKTITLELKLKTLLDRETITKRTILPFVLRKGSKNYPTASRIQNKLDDLYGASLQIIGHKAGSYHIITFQMEIPNQKFIGNEKSIITEALAFLKDIAFHPNVVSNAFDETTTTREKETITNYLQSIKDDKMSYANLRLVDEMSTGERYQIRPFGYLEDMDDINGASLYSYYKKTIENDQIDLFVVGDVDTNEMEKAIKEHVDGFRNATHKETIQPEGQTIHQLKHDEPNVVVEKDTVQQAKLHIGYRTNTAYKDADFPSMLLCHTILGAHPGAKLFINVREKNSLAYYAASGLDFFTDKLFIYSGIAPEDYEEARTIMEEQVTAMQAGDITDNEIKEAKTLIDNQHRSSLDNAGGIIDLLYEQDLGNKKRSVDVLLTQVNALTKEDVVASANKLQQDTVFLLTSKEEK